MRTVCVDAVHSMGSCDNALVIVWRGVPTRETVAGVRHAAEGLLREFPAGIGILGVSGELPLTSADDRRRLAPLLDDLGDRMLALASIIEGGSRVPDVLSCLNRVMCHPCPLQVFATVDEGVAWLASRLRRTAIAQPGAAALRRCVEELRRERVPVLYS